MKDAKHTLATLLCTAIIFASVAWASAATVTLTVVGNPATQPWGVLGTIADTRAMSVDTYLDGKLYGTQSLAPYAFPDDDGTNVLVKKFGNGTHAVMFVFKLKGTTTEIGRNTVTVVEGAPAVIPNTPGNLTVISFPSPTVTSLLTWTASPSSDVIGYKIYRSTTSGSYGAPLALLGVVTSYQATGLTPGGTYFWTVTAFDAAGNESPKSNEATQ